MKDLFIYFLFSISCIGLIIYNYFVIKNPKKDYEANIPIIKNLYEDIDLDKEE